MPGTVSPNAVVIVSVVKGIIDIPENDPEAIYYDPKLFLLWGLTFHSFTQWFIHMRVSETESHTEVFFCERKKNLYLNEGKSLIFVGKSDKFMRTFFQNLSFLSPSYINTIWSLNCFEWLFVSLLLFSPSVRGLSTKPKPPENWTLWPNNFNV